MYSLFVCLLLSILSACYGNHNNRIIGGTNASIFGYNYYVFLIIKGATYCGGTLVTTNKIVTAAHCVRNAKGTEINAYPGLGSFAELKNTTSYTGISVAVHKNYTSGPLFDIAVLQLDKVVELNSKIQLIPLATIAPPVGAVLTVVGYGRIICNDNGKGLCSPSKSASTLQRADMIVERFEESIMSTHSPKSNTCYGDSGSPFKYEGKFVAVVSRVSGLCDIVNYEVSVAHPDIRKFLVENIENS